MQPVGPYNFIRVLGLCQVGAVWSAADEQGQPLTVAVLDEPVARDQRWREAFAATVNGLAQPGPDRPRYVRADFSVPAPWAAYAGALGDGPGAERIFEALGQQVRPAGDSAGAAAPATAGADDSDPAQPTARLDLNAAAPAVPAAAAAAAPAWQPTSGQPAMNGDPAAPISAPPDPISGMPMSPAGQPQSPASYDLVYSTEPDYQDPFASPVRHIVPSEPKKRRTGLWVGLTLAVVVLLAAAGTLFVLTGGGDDPGPKPTATATAAAPVPVPTGTAAHPGIEPPKPGNWPAWPKFGKTEGAQELSDLDGVGFTVSVPQGWSCNLAARGAGFVRYTCGNAPGDNPEIGGELTVRDCPHLCDEVRRSAMRRAEEAWGRQWNRGSRLSAYAETLQINGAARYGLVLVAYWRTSVDDAVNKQVVMRMTAPVQQADELRKIANSIRDSTFF